LAVEFGRPSHLAVRVEAHDRRKPFDIVAGLGEDSAGDSHPHVAFDASVRRTLYSYHQLRISARSAEQAIRTETALEAVGRWTERKSSLPLQERFDPGLHPGCGVASGRDSGQPNQCFEGNDVFEAAQHRRPQPQATPDQDCVHRSDLRRVIAE